MEEERVEALRKLLLGLLLTAQLPVPLLGAAGKVRLAHSGAAGGSADAEARREAAEKMEAKCEELLGLQPDAIAQLLLLEPPTDGRPAGWRPLDEAMRARDACVALGYAAVVSEANWMLIAVTFNCTIHFFMYSSRGRAGNAFDAGERRGCFRLRGLTRRLRYYAAATLGYKSPLAEAHELLDATMLARRTDVNALGGELARLEAELQASREERAREAAEHEAEKAAPLVA